MSRAVSSRDRTAEHSDRIERERNRLISKLHRVYRVFSPL